MLLITLLNKGESSMIKELDYNYDEFFDEDGWIRDIVYRGVAVGEDGRVEVLGDSNRSYYEQNSYYTIVKNLDSDIQDDEGQFEACILRELQELES